MPRGVRGGKRVFQTRKQRKQALNAVTDSSPIHACAIVGLLQIVHIAQVELISLRHRVVTCAAGYDESDTRAFGQRTRVAHTTVEKGLVVSCHHSPQQQLKRTLTYINAWLSISPARSTVLPSHT
jgi:hypothetical protein